MASTGLPVDRFISKIRQEAKNLREVGKRIDDEEMSSVLLMGLSDDFHVISTRLQEEDQDNFTFIAERVNDYAVDNGLENKIIKSGSKKASNGDGDAAYLICNRYLQGNCKYGDKCKFKHENRSGTVKKDSGDKKSSENQKKSKDKASVTCFNCGKTGHYKSECKSQKKKDKAMAVKEKESESEDDDVLAAVISIGPKVLSMMKDKATTKSQMWGLDSCASRHLTNDFNDLEPESIEDVEDMEMMVGNSEMIKISKRGSVRIQQDGPVLKLQEVYYTPQLPMKLISVGLLTKAGLDMTTECKKGQAEIRKGDKLILTAELRNGIFILQPKILKSKDAKENRNRTEKVTNENSAEGKVRKVSARVTSGRILQPKSPGDQESKVLTGLFLPIQQG